MIQTLLRILLKFWYAFQPLLLCQAPCCKRERRMRSTARYSATFRASLATPDMRKFSILLPSYLAHLCQEQTPRLDTSRMQLKLCCTLAQG